MSFTTSFAEPHIMDDHNPHRSPPPPDARRVEDKLNSAIDSAQQKITDTIAPLKEDARSLMEQQKSLGADQLRDVARAVHTAAHEFEGQMPCFAQSVHRMARRLDDVSSSLRSRNVDEVVESVGQFAREQPAMFFGGAVLAGFALSRFLKSSGEHGVTGPGAS